MAFETGVSTSPSDLLAKIETHAVATAGWTLVRNNGSPGAQLSISDGSATEANQFNFLADNTAAIANISMQPSVGDGGVGVAFTAHTGSPENSGANGTFIVMGHRGSATDQGFSGTHVAYFIFSGSTTNGRYMHVVVEGTAGVYFHMMWGTIEKAGTFVGGQYATSLFVRSQGEFVWPFEFSNAQTRATQWVRCDDFYTTVGQTTDAGASRWFEGIGMAHNNVSSANYAAPWYQGGLIEFNQRTPFGPNLIIVWDALTPSATTTAHKIIGHIPDMRLCSLQGRSSGDVVTIGADDWHLFPAHRRVIRTGSSTYLNTFTGGGAPNHDSGEAGFALLKVP